MDTKIHFSSRDVEWKTPIELFEALNQIFAFTLDACASSTNALCPKYYSQEDSCLDKDWRTDRVWMNPPYGRNIKLFVEKAYKESLQGALVVSLLPARVDTRWFHDFVSKGEYYFIKGRIKFSGNQNNAPFPSLVSIFYPHGGLVCGYLLRAASEGE